MSEDNPQITFGESAAETVIDQFGWTTDPTGIIVDKGTREAISGYNTDCVHINNLAGIVDKEGEPVPLEDDWSAITDYVWSEEGV